MGSGQGHCDATYSWQHNPKASCELEHLRLTAETPHAGYLILRLRNYPAWQIGMNGDRRLGREPALCFASHRDDGLMPCRFRKARWR